MKGYRHYSQWLAAVHMRVRRFAKYVSDYRKIETIRKSEFFDSGWYLSTYPDVAVAGVDPAKHYYYNGASEGRDPSEKFNSNWYRSVYLEGKVRSQNPLLHYARVGARNGNAIVPPTPWWIDSDSDAKWSEPVFTDRLVDIGFVHGRPVAVIVPVFNAVEQLLDCLNSLVENTPQPCRFIIIDDGSTDASIEKVLNDFSERPRFEVYRNEVNCGFTRTVNRGLTLAEGCDVVLLNSDTVVTPGWLRNMKIAAYSSGRIGTVTPFSDNAGAFSAPKMGQPNSIPNGISSESYARAVTQVSRRTHPRVPTGNGFCMYIRQDCLKEVGLFDAEAFPRGYGEENDFCMRAGRLGWEHVVDDATLIYHVRSASFGDEKDVLMKQGRAIIEERYPEYGEEIRVFTHSDVLVSARQRIAQIPAQLATHKGSRVRRRVLYVLSTQTGGTPQTNQDLMIAIEHDVEAFVLRCNAVRLSLSHFSDGVYTEVAAHLLKRRVEPFPHRSDEYDAVVAEWLVRFSIELVHVRHIAWHGLGLIDVSKNIDIPVVFSFHDFYAVCPTVNLLNEEAQFCSGQCSRSSAPCSSPLWPEDDFSDLRDSKVYIWRDQFKRVLSRCDAFVTTSESTKSLCVSNFPFLKSRPFHVIPHGRDFQAFEDLAEPLGEGEPLRILVPGNLNAPKGGQIVSTLARLSPGKFELHVLGNVARKINLPKTPNVVVHGAYRRDEFTDYVRRIRPHIGAVLSVCPETYCHTLSELWACGIPVLGFDVGAVGERLRDTGAGWVLKEKSAFSIFNFIECLAGNPSEITEKASNARAWQEKVARTSTCFSMGRRYLEVYKSAICPELEDRWHGIAAQEARELCADKSGSCSCQCSVPRSKIRASSESPQKNRLILIPSLRADHVPAGSGYVRLIVPYQSSAVTGNWEVGTNVSGRLPRPGTADVAIIQRGDSPVFSTRQLKEWVAAWRSAGGKIIYDVDDDLLDVVGLSARRVAGTPEAIVERASFLATQADMVTVSTQPLFEKFSGLNSNIKLLVNNIQFELWHKLHSACKADDAASTPIRIGYMGTATHDDDLAVIQDAMLLVQDRYKGRVAVEVVGAFQHRRPLFGERVPLPLYTDYVNFALWAQRNLDWDIGVIPLTYDSFNASKSDLKFLEYAALGVAIVCSDALPYKSIAEHGKNCLIAENTTVAWYEAVCRLIEDNVLREELASTANRQVLQDRSIKAESSSYLEVLDSVMEILYERSPV